MRYYRFVGEHAATFTTVQCFDGSTLHCEPGQLVAFEDGADHPLLSELSVPPDGDADVLYATWPVPAEGDVTQATPSVEPSAPPRRSRSKQQEA